MKAMIFAAGLGTRLRPLTNHIPKALVPVNGVPLLELVIRKIKKAGINQLVVNVHHFADQIQQFLEANAFFGCEVFISDERTQVLETGGGLNKVRSYLKDAPFLVHNSDIISNIQLESFIQTHLESEAIATLAVRKRETSRYLLFNENRHLVGWQNVKTDAIRMSRESNVRDPYAFSGIHVISPEIFNYMPQQEEKFSIIETYLEAAKKEIILGYPHDADIWLDVGKPDQLEAAKRLSLQAFT